MIKKQILARSNVELTFYGVAKITAVVDKDQILLGGDWSSILLVFNKDGFPKEKVGNFE
jgi:hypothetical protein